MEYGGNTDVASASMTLFLSAVSVGRWLMVRSIGCRVSQTCCAIALLTAYVANSACGAVGRGTGRCGLIGTGPMTGFLTVSRTGVFVNTSTKESVHVPPSMVAV